MNKRDMWKLCLVPLVVPMCFLPWQVNVGFVLLALACWFGRGDL